MSTTVDKRVVEMRFDNKQFESNVATSMSTLEKLKKSLKLDGATKSLEDINTASKKIDMSGLGGAVETVKAKFSALDVVAVTALANITNSAVNTGKRLISSLSIDQVTAGWSKYEQKTASVQTIMNSTGKTIDQVNGYLDKLMWYSDETSYGFTDMTQSLAQLTSAGGDIEKLIPMIEGIANATAFAGKGAAEFSRAIYNLNQSYSMGYMQYMDWKSLDLAGISSKQLKQVFIDTAKELGRLNEAAETANGTLVTTSTFASTLSEKWADTEVMEKAFGKFAKVTEAAYEMVEDGNNKIDNATVAYKVLSGELGNTSEEYLSLSESQKALVGTFSDVEIAAAKSAQEAKTFTEAIDATKDAVSSGWMRSVETIFGNYDQAKKLWSDVCEQLWDIFASSGERRNDILSEAMTSNWDKLINKIEVAGVTADDFETKLIETAREHGIAIDDLIDEYGSLSEVISAGKLSKSVIVETIKKLSGTFTKTSEAVETTTTSLEHFQDMVNKVIRGDFGNGIDRVNALTAAGEDAAAIQTLVDKVWEKTRGTWSDTTITAEELAEVIGDLSTEELQSIGYTEEQANSLKELAEQAEKTGTPINELLENLTKPSGRQLVFSTIHNSLASISELLGTFRTAWSDIFTDSRVTSGLYNALSKIQSFSEKVLNAITNNAEKLTSTFKGLIAIFDILVNIVGGALKAAFDILGVVIGGAGSTVLDITGNVGDAIVAFRNWLFENNIITRAFNKLVSAATSVIDVIKRWIKAFKEIPVISRLIEKVQGAFESIGDSAKDMDGTSEKIKGWIASFKELPAVKTILEGISSAFNSIANVVEGSITAIGAWFEKFKETEGVKELVSAVTELVDAIGKRFRGEINVSDFAISLGSSLARLLASLPKIAIQFGKDFINGFILGLGDGVSSLIKKVIGFCSNFCSAFAEALGIHSSPTISYEYGSNWWQGFINSCKDVYAKVVEAIQPIVDAIKNTLKSLFDYFKDEDGNVDWGKIFTIGATVESLIILKQFTNALQTFSNAISEITSITSGVNSALKGLGKMYKGIGADFNAKAILKMAISIGIIVAAIFLLTKIDDIGKLWNAVGVIVVLSGILVGLAWAMKQFSAASIEVNKEGINIKGIQSALLKIGFAILLVAAAVKLIGDMDADKAKKGFIGIAGVAVGMMIFLAAIGGISRYSKDVSGIGGMMIKISFALILMVGVCKLVGKLSSEEIGKGIIFATGFSIFVMLIAAVAKDSQKDIKYIGTMATRLSFAMLLLVGVCKLIGMLSEEEMKKGAAFAGAFVIFVGALVAVTKIGSDKKLAKVSGIVLSVSFSLLLLVGVCKILDKISVEELIKGAAIITGFTLLLKMMVGFLTIGDKQQVANVSKTILAMSTALLMMAGAAVILGMIDIVDLTKGIVAVGILGGIVSLMVHSLKGAQNAKAAVIAMAATVVLLAGAIIALSYIDEKSLKTSTACMTFLIGSFSLMIRSLKGLNSKKVPVKAIGALAGVIIILGGVVALLSHIMKDTDTAIAATVSIIALALTMTLLLKILSNMSFEVGNAKTAILGLTAMVIPLLAFAIVLSLASGIQNAERNAIVLAGFATAMTVLLAALTLIGALVMGTGGVGATAIIAGILALTAMAIPMLAFIGVLALMSSVENAIANAIVLGTLMTIMSDVLVKVSLVAPLALIGVTAMTALALLMVAIGDFAIELGKLMSENENIKKFLDEGLPTLEKLAGSIGIMIGSFIGNIGESLSDSLVKIGENISIFMDKLKTASDKASGVKSESFDGVEKLIGVLAKIGLSSIGTSIADIFTIGGTSMEKFEKDGTAFFNAMKAIGEAASDVSINEENMDAVIGVAEKLVALQSSLEPIGGVITWFTGRDDLGTFGINAAAFVFSMKLAFSSLGDTKLNTDAMDSIISAATSLSTLQSSLEPIGGVISWFKGRDDLGTFGINASAFILSMKLAFSSLEGEKLDTDSMDSIVSAANSLVTLQSSLEPIGGVVSWFTGRDDLGTFGVNIAVFVGSMKTAFDSLDGAELNTDAMNSIIRAATSLATLQSSLEPIGGVISWFTGRDDLGTFGVNASAFVYSMKLSFSSLDGAELNTDAMNSIIRAATSLATLQSSLEPIGGVISWFKGRDDLGTFGINAAAFIISMKTALAALDGTSLDSEALDSVVAAATKLSEFEQTLDPAGGVIDWFTSGKHDLGTFGTNVGLFADGMAKLKTGFGESGISGDVVTSITIAGEALIALQKALPEEHWFDGKMNLSDFSTRVSDFATAMSDFGTKASGIDSAAVDLAINTAHRIKNLIVSLSDLDTSGLAEFTGIGTGGFGADGAAYKIAQAIAAFSDKVADINTQAVSVAVSSAQKLKSLIASLVGLDTSGIENFKPEDIGKQMKNYADKVSGIDTGTVASSISSANRLKNFISSLSSLDTSGIVNFKVGSIGSSLKSYSESVAGFNAGVVSSSITAANRLKNFITSLSGINTLGVSSFKSAINQLSTVNIAELVKAFSGESTKLQTAGVNMFNVLIKGMQSRLPFLKTIVGTMLNIIVQLINSKASTFSTLGQNLISRLASGFSNKKNLVALSASSCLLSAVTSIRGNYNSFYNAGSYLVTGFSNGISENSYKASAKAKAMAEAAVKAAREALKINSPSKVFKKIGSGIPEGFAMGIGMFGGDIKDSIDGMASTAIKSTNSTMSIILDALSGDMNAQPTIRPVVDLSDVKTGAAAVNGMFDGIQTVGVRSNLNAINSTMNAKLQNGSNDDVISAINKLGTQLESSRGDTYNFGDFTYDNGSEVADAIGTLIRYAKIGRRV